MEFMCCEEKSPLQLYEIEKKNKTQTAPLGLPCTNQSHVSNVHFQAFVVGLKWRVRSVEESELII